MPSKPEVDIRILSLSLGARHSCGCCVLGAGKGRLDGTSLRSRHHGILHTLSSWIWKHLVGFHVELLSSQKVWRWVMVSDWVVSREDWLCRSIVPQAEVRIESELARRERKPKECDVGSEPELMELFTFEKRWSSLDHGWALHYRGWLLFVIHFN